VLAPDLGRSQLTETVLEIPAQESPPWPLEPVVLEQGKSGYGFLHLHRHQSQTEDAKLGLEVRLNGAKVPEAEGDIQVPAGRYHRLALTERIENTLELKVVNKEIAPASVKVIAGAMAIAPPGEQPRFRRGDCDGDGEPTLTDAVVGLNWLFKVRRSPCAWTRATRMTTGRRSSRT